MSVVRRIGDRWVIALAASLLSWEAIGQEFVVRPVTHFGGQPIVSSALPLTVAGNRLVLSATEDGHPRIYSTDGNSIQIIDQTISIPNNPNVAGGIELARLGGSVYFPGIEMSGSSRLYATDGITIRQVGGVAHSGPQDFALVNGNLVFKGGLSRLYHTDGTKVEDFAVAKSSFAGTARANDRLVFRGFPVNGGTVLAYSTDGQALSTIVTSGGQSLVGPQHLTELGSNAYFVAGGLNDPAIYRTSDGLVAERIAGFQDFTFTNFASRMFAFQGILYIQVDNILTRESVIYKSSGGLPSEVLTWQVPAGGTQAVEFDNPSLFVDEHRAYFAIRSGPDTLLYAFDGDSFDEIDLGGTYRELEFTQFGGRTFLNARGLSESLALYELIDGNLIHLGPGLDSMMLFQGELFGINIRFPSSVGPTTLFRTENGQLVSLGDFGQGRFSIHETRFVEFDGKLYFSGAVGLRDQLFAVVVVPEPTMSTSFAIVSMVVAFRPWRTGRKRQ